MKKEEECEKDNNNESNELISKTLDIRNLNEINNDIDNDKETDDILTKLGNLSQNSDDKSFDSPIIFNRTKTFYDGIKTEDSRKKLYESFIMTYKANINKLDNNTYKSRNKTIKREFRPRSLINIKKIKNRNISNFKREIERYSMNEDIPEIIRNNSINNIKVNFNKLERINEDIIDNKIDNNKIENINKKVENIIVLIKEIKYIDKKLKKKDLNKIIKNCISKDNNEIDINNIYEFIDELLDYIIEILNSIQNNSKKSTNNKVGNEKIILKLQNELKEKDKQMGEIINKMNLEKDKLTDTYKSSSSEIINLKKQNKELLNKLTNAEKHISKLEINNEILEEKMKNSILEKNNKTINSSTSIRSSFINSGNSKIEPPSLDASYMTIKSMGPIYEVNKNNKQKINDKYNNAKKLNLNLIDLLKQINNMICYYDSFLNKEFGTNKNMQNLVKNLISFMDITGLTV